MKTIATYIRLTIIVASLFLSAGCENWFSRSKYTIFVDDTFTCSYDAQTIEIRYKVGESYELEQPIRVNATTDCDWITEISNNELGYLRINIMENEGSQRSAKVTLSANGVKTPREMEIIQFASPALHNSEHTLIFYFFGTSLNTYFGYNLDDASTAISGDILGNNRVIYIRQTDATSATIGELSYDPINNKTINTVKESISLPSNSNTQEDVASILQRLANHAPASRYGIVLAGHGRGWVPRDIVNGTIEPYCITSSYQDIWSPAEGSEITRAFGERNTLIDINELAKGIEQSGLNVDYLLFDACFMSSIEALYELRNVANYIIASPCEIMGRGFPYHRVLPHLFANNGTSSDIIEAAESYYLYYRDEYTGSSRCGSVAVVDCAELNALAEATHNVMATAKSSYNKGALQTYEGQSNHIFYDFGQWCNTVATDSKALAEFNTQYSNTVIAKYTLPTFYSAYGSYGTYPIDEEVYSGVTTSAPSNIYQGAWQETSWYKRITE